MALTDFFGLNKPFTEFDQERLVSHFTVSNDLRNVLYRPNELAPRSPYRLEGKTFENVSFSKTRLKNVVFRNCSFKDCLFIGTEFIDCEFHECRFHGCNPHKSTFQGCYIDPSVFAKLLDSRQHTNIGLHLFNQLEQNARKQEQHEFVATAAYYYRRWRRLDLNWRYRQGRISRVKWLSQWTPNILYDLIAGYGWRISRFLLSSLVLLTVAILANYVLWEDLGMQMAYPKNGPKLLISAYFTIVTLSTLGYGDITPASTIGMFAASVEALLGLIWLSILASVVFRRVFRS
jgi:hypothetical protein